MTILVDMDDTIEQLLAALVKKANERFNRSATIDEITKEMYGGAFKRNEDLAAPSGATILDKALKMPVTWKASIGICKGKRQEQKAACIEYVESKYGIDLYESDDIADSIGILTYAMNNNE